MTESKTPLTDAEEFIVPSELDSEERWRHNGEYVSRTFARRLETELDQARATIAELRADVAHWMAMQSETQTARELETAALRKRLVESVEAGAAWCAQAESIERDCRVMGNTFDESMLDMI